MDLIRSFFSKNGLRGLITQFFFQPVNINDKQSAIVYEYDNEVEWRADK